MRNMKYLGYLIIQNDVPIFKKGHKWRQMADYKYSVACTLISTTH